MQWLVNIIKEKEDEIIHNSKTSLDILEDTWKPYVNKSTYMVYQSEIDSLKLVKKGLKEVAIPWYFFWNYKLKNQLNSNLENLKHLEQSIHSYNDEFVAERKLKYLPLFTNDDIVLDDDQQTAIVTDDKHNLVVAGAGSGKTEVLVTRIAYLVKRKQDGIKPNRILALAFQDKAAKEMKERLKKRFKLDIEIRTFHSLGNKIISDYCKKNAIEPPKLNTSSTEQWKYNNQIKKIFEEQVKNDDSFQNLVFDFMNVYGDKDIISKKADFEDKEDFYNYMKNLRYTALDGTPVKSEAERAILNYFLSHKLNGEKINISYEEPAEWMVYTNEQGEERVSRPDFYFNDFDIYLEHWATDKNGNVPAWFEGGKARYNKGKRAKMKQFEEHNKTLFTTSNQDYIEGHLIESVEKRFIATLLNKKSLKNVKLSRYSYEELVDMTWESAQFVKGLPGNIANYITIAKTYSLKPSEIDNILKKNKWSARQIAFANIAKVVYKKYQEQLEEHNQIDFSDMINKANDYLKKDKSFYSNTYDHILIDEYQDISTQRFNMVKNILDKNENAKLFCVGDDWQSIMGFSGSNLNFFVNFEKYFAHPARSDLTINYRSFKTIVDAGKAIISNNKSGQIKKESVANSHSESPIQVYASTHTKRFFTKYYDQIAQHSMSLIKKIKDEKNYKFGDFMILMRIAKKEKLRNALTNHGNSLGIPITENPEDKNKVTIMSVHKSKGLQAKVVIILNVDKGLYGFPCELESPDFYETAILDNDGLREQEERRLFYVAVTRAKEEVIMYTQRDCESKFITEIKEFVKRDDLRY